MKKLFILPFALWALASQAQVFPYELTVLNETYQDLADPNSFTTTPDWDEIDEMMDLGFDFTMFGATFNSINVTEPSNLIQFNGTLMNLYCPMYADVRNGDSLSVVSGISYTVEGAAPNRIAKLEWRNVALYNEYDSLNTFNMRLNYQVWFYEGTNVFEYRYGANTVTDIFFLNEMAAPFIYFVTDLDLMAGTPGPVWSLQGDAASPTVGLVPLESELPPSSAMLNSIPANGTVYRFAPLISASVSENKANVFRAYPTLFENNIVIENELNGNQVAVLRDITGKEIQRFTVAQGKQSIDLSYLTSGVYVIQMSNSTQRIIKQ